MRDKDINNRLLVVTSKQVRDALNNLKITENDYYSGAIPFDNLYRNLADKYSAGRAARYDMIK